MSNHFPGNEIKEGNILPCYFFFGKEIYQAHQFIDALKNRLISPDIQGLNLERFSLEESSWVEVIDLARTVPFFFSPWRIIVVDTSAREDLSSSEEKILAGYFSSPSPRTVLVVLFSDKIPKNKSLYRFFSSLPSSQIKIKELKILKERNLFSWMDGKLSLLGKAATPEAKSRLLEVVGNNLQMLDNELEKLVTYVGEKRVIDLDDVNLVADWVKSVVEWELANSLEKADLEQCLIILDRLFTEGVKPEYVLGIISAFFRDILLAKVWLKEKKKDRKEIFRELKPRISEKYGSLYATKFHNFFALVEGLALKELNGFLAELRQIDLKMKTSDASPQALLEGFFYSYCRFQERARLI
ncbi:MAG: DNA polymerase III subunit delta [Candidatus Aminicenantales bacterium]